MPLLPDPEPREKHYKVISVDDHFCEPPDTFEGRIPAHLVDGAPRVVEEPDGSQVWVMEGVKYPNIGLNAVSGRPKEEWNFEPSRFDEMRKGAWDIHARVADMDIDGIDASVCFPSLIAGFAGTKFSKLNNKELGLACVRAWNDFVSEVWAGSYPGRMIPLQLTWLNDPELGAQMVRENAARGFKALSLPESFHHVGYPSIHTTHWDPILRACEETETVICLHTGTGQWNATLSPEAPIEQATALFAVCGLAACADWLWAKVPLRFPKLKVAFSEGGIGWVAMLLDRLDYMTKHELGSIGSAWTGDISPSEALQRNFYFCSIYDPSTIGTVERIGADNVMLEIDYPHASSTWPDSQEFIRSGLGHLRPELIEKITHSNAERLFRHPLT